MFSVQLLTFSGLILATSCKFALQKFQNNTCAQKCPCPPECPPGWRMWQGTCFRFTLKMEWAEAKAACEAMGGELHVPRSLEENIHLHAANKEVYGNNHIWIASDDTTVCPMIKTKDNLWEAHGNCDGPHSGICSRAPKPRRMYCFTANKQGRLDKACFEPSRNLTTSSPITP